MAISYGQHGRYDEAERLWREVLEARERTLGADHPDTLATKHELRILRDGHSLENALFMYLAAGGALGVVAFAIWLGLALRRKRQTKSGRR